MAVGRAMPRPQSEARAVFERIVRHCFSGKALGIHCVRSGFYFLLGLGFGDG
jgi:hypothetical protein